MIYRIAVAVLAVMLLSVVASLSQERWGGSAKAFVIAVGTSTTIVCAPVTEGTLFYDTDAGGAGTLDDGLLCVCGDDVLQGYVWRDVNTPTAELGGSSTTNCGT